MIPNDTIFPTATPGWGDRRIDLLNPSNTMISSNHKTTLAERLREMALSKSRDVVNEVYDRLIPLAEIAALEGKLFITASIGIDEAEFITHIAQKFRDNGFKFSFSEQGNTGRYAVRIEF